MQVGTHDKVWLVDPLNIEDMTPLYDILEDENIVKVFHDTSFDFSILARYGCHPKNIIDTHRASLLLGKQPSLNLLMKEYLGTGKAGEEQRADWLKRPLTEKLMEYAAQDVAQLLELKDHLLDDLKKLGRLDWLLEDCSDLQANDLPIPSHHCLKGASKLTPQQRGVLRELFKVRESIAKKVDKPVFFIIRHNQLLELATRPPRNIAGWKRLRGIHPAVRHNAEKFVQAVNKGLSHPEKHVPCKEKLFIPKIADTILAKRDEIAEELGIQGYIIMTKEQAKNVVESGSLDCLRNWQRDLVSKCEEFSRFK